MKFELLNMLLAFFEGFALIISPCILPILPIVLAGSISGSKRRPFGIIIGFVLVFALFTFFSRKLVQLTGIDLNFIRYIAFALLIFFAVIMLSDSLTEKFSYFTRRFSNIGSNSTFFNNPQGGLTSGILFGGLIAVIWTPCAGPILAAVIVQTVIQHSDFSSFLTLLSFALGAVVPMFLIAYFGREIMEKLDYFQTRTIFFRKLLGIIIILSVIYMIFVEKEMSVRDTVVNNNNEQAFQLKNYLSNPYPAPAIKGIEHWINSPPLQLDELKGKVVLIDFWTYSCINCIRTLPYLKEWYTKYHDKGFVIIGIHTPEFEFEKNLTNVKNAVDRFGIKYPVALDNHFVTWLNFKNSYWPAHYLIDKNGNVVYTHFGEGEYAVTENNIRFLLGLDKMSQPTKSDDAYSFNQTPETYLGYLRADHFSSPEIATKDQSASYTFPKELSANDWALQGHWQVMAEKIVANESNASIKINFHARKVFVVMGNNSGKEIKVKILLNNKPVTTDLGQDVKEGGYVIVNQHSLYEILQFNHSESGVLQLIATVPGLEIYTFTFG